MSSDKDLRRFVNDSLHDVLGFSENTMVDFVCSLAKSARSVPQLLSKLQEADVPANDRTKRFASELFSRVPRQSGSKASASDSARQQQREQVDLLKRNQQYEMLPAEEEDDDGEDDVNAAVQKALQEKEDFISNMDGIYGEYGVPGAGGLLQALDDAIDERDQSLAMIDQLAAFLAPRAEGKAKSKKAARPRPSGADPQTKGKTRAEDPDTIRPAWNASIKVVDRINPHFDKELGPRGAAAEPPCRTPRGQLRHGGHGRRQRSWRRRRWRLPQRDRPSDAAGGGSLGAADARSIGAPRLEHAAGGRGARAGHQPAPGARCRGAAARAVSPRNERDRLSVFLRRRRETDTDRVR